MYAGEGHNNPQPSHIVLGDGTPTGTQDVPLSPQTQVLLHEKQMLSTEYSLVRRGKADAKRYQQHLQEFEQRRGVPKTAKRLQHGRTIQGENVSGVTVSPYANYVEMTLEVTQYPQSKSYYCGPGSAYSILEFLQIVKGKTKSYDNETLSQSTLATMKYLETENWGGSPWSTSNGHPYPETLSYWITGNYYGLYVAQGSPVASTYKSNLTADIDAAYPLAGNTVENANQSHYNNHPRSINIYHWIAMRGYAASGDTTYYVDPAANASSVGWSGVQPYGIISSNTLVTFMSQRGYVW